MIKLPKKWRALSYLLFTAPLYLVFFSSIMAAAAFYAGLVWLVSDVLRKRIHGRMLVVFFVASMCASAVSVAQLQVWRTLIAQKSLVLVVTMDKRHFMAANKAQIPWYARGALFSYKKIRPDADAMGYVFVFPLSRHQVSFASGRFFRVD